MAGAYYNSILKRIHLTVSQPGTEVSAGCAYISSVSPVGEELILARLKLLAPILHLIADLCVPHHVAGTNGCGHELWENAVGTDCAGEPLGYFDNDVTRGYSSKYQSGLFDIAENDIDGPLFKGMFSAEKFLLHIAKQTVASTCLATGRNREFIVQSGIPFWIQYLSDQTVYKMVLQRKELFNQAVAASAFFLARAYPDLVKLGITTEVVRKTCC
jgi:hypothetical protein